MALTTEPEMDLKISGSRTNFSITATEINSFNVMYLKMARGKNVQC